MGPCTCSGKPSCFVALFALGLYFEFELSLRRIRRNHVNTNNRAIGSSNAIGRSQAAAAVVPPGNAKEGENPNAAADEDATVAALATGNNMPYGQFVGTLRRSGYRGRILLGVAPELPLTIRAYLKEQNVTTFDVHPTPCTFRNYTDAHYNKIQTCVSPYPDFKISWGRYALFRDYFKRKDCATCWRGPILLTDFRDVIFQKNPFGSFSEDMKNALQVFEESPRVRTTHWLVSWPVEACYTDEKTGKKTVQLGDQPMLCSGTTLGPKNLVLQYLEKMVKTFEAWSSKKKCRFSTIGDDQAVHDYLYYTGQLKELPAKAVPHRTGVVHTVGYEGDVIYRKHVKTYGNDGGRANDHNYAGANFPRTWISPENAKVEDSHSGGAARSSVSLINKNGLFTNFDGSVSPVIHQFDRLGPPYQRWLNQNAEKLEILSRSASDSIGMGKGRFSAEMVRQPGLTGLNSPTVYAEEKGPGDDFYDVVRRSPLYNKAMKKSTNDAQIMNDEETIRAGGTGTKKALFEEEKIDNDIFTSKKHGFFSEIRKKIDDMDATERCRRYDAPLLSKGSQKRRLFYGSNIADEALELFEVVAAEVFEIYAGVVFVEANRTYSFTPRKFKRTGSESSNVFGKLFGTNVTVREYVNEDARTINFERENSQRMEIIKGWQTLGMQAHDVGIIGDADETFSRDFLLAAQTCDLPELRHEHHYCKGFSINFINKIIYRTEEIKLYVPVYEV